MSYPKSIFHKIFKALAGMTFLTLIGTSVLCAEEALPSKGERLQPTVQAGSVTPATPNESETPQKHGPENSLDFLAQDSTITPSELFHQKPGGEEEVAFLLAEECSEKDNNVIACHRTYSNGNRATVVTQTSQEGDELKRQTVIEESNREGTLLYRKTIRHRLDYNYREGQKTKEKELFDIIYQPADKPATRELMVYEYSLETGTPRSLSWTQYKQTDKEGWASLTFHTLLRYGDDGAPERAIAEAWHQGKKTETFMDWNRRATGYALWDKDAWKQWEGWIRNVSLQAYLP